MTSLSYRNVGGVGFAHINYTQERLCPNLCDACSDILENGSTVHMPVGQARVYLLIRPKKALCQCHPVTHRTNRKEFAVVVY